MNGWEKQWAHEEAEREKEARRIAECEERCSALRIADAIAHGDD